MTEKIITYSCLIILLPIVPSLILYLAIPKQESTVDGKFKGLNIKLKGAFGSYFILTLLLVSFITTMRVTEHKFEYWRIEGQLDMNGITDPRQVKFLIQPPILQMSDDGRFVIEDVPINKGENQLSTLNIQLITNDLNKRKVVHLERESFVPFPTHELKFEGNNVSIITPIILEPDASQNTQNQTAGSYNPDNAQRAN